MKPLNRRSYRCDEPRRAWIVRESFCRHARQRLPHCDREIAAIAEEKYVAIACSEERQHPIRKLIDRLEARGKYFGDLAKRKPLSVVLDVHVDGTLQTQFCAVWAAFAKASGFSFAEARVNVDRNGIRLSWATGSYTIRREVLLPLRSEYASYTGVVSIDEALTKRGGPFRFALTEQGLRMESIANKVSTWRVAIALLREHRARRGGMLFKDIVYRFRRGAKLSFASVEERWRKAPRTKVTLAAGRPDATWLAAVNELQARAGRRAAVASQVWTDLCALGEQTAVEFCSDERRIRENAARELRAAQESFNEASRQLFTLMAEVCRKVDCPAAPYRTMPESFPEHKVVSDGKARTYSHQKTNFTASWKRLAAARAAVGTTNTLNEPSERQTVAPLSVPGAQAELALG